MAIPGRDTWTLIQRAHSLVIRLDEGDRGSPQKDHFGSGPQVHRKMWRGIFKHQGVKLPGREVEIHHSVPPPIQWTIKAV